MLTTPTQDVSRRSVHRARSTTSTSTPAAATATNPLRSAPRIVLRHLRRGIRPFDACAYASIASAKLSPTASRDHHALGPPHNIARGMPRSRDPPRPAGPPQGASSTTCRWSHHMDGGCASAGLRVPRGCAPPLQPKAHAQDVETLDVASASARLTTRAPRPARPVHPASTPKRRTFSRSASTSSAGRETQTDRCEHRLGAREFACDTGNLAWSRDPRRGIDLTRRAAIRTCRRPARDLSIVGDSPTCTLARPRNAARDRQGKARRCHDQGSAGTDPVTAAKCATAPTASCSIATTVPRPDPADPGSRRRCVSISPSDPGAAPNRLGHECITG